MGLFNFKALAEFATAPNAANTGYVSPFSPTDSLSQAIVGDIFGYQTDVDYDAPISRAEAMTIPSLIRARGILMIIASQPLIAYKGSERLARQPGWLNRTDTSVSPQARIVATMDDLIFHGESLWVVARNSSGAITDAVRMPFEKWRVAVDGTIEVNVAEGKWQPVTDPKSVIHFQGFQEGVCTIGAPALRAARDIQRSVAARAKSPVPLLDLHITDDVELTSDEKALMRREWNAALRDPDGSVATTPHNVEAKPLGAEGTNDFLTAARNGSRLDIANLMQVPASLLEGSTSTASLTYSTSEGKRSELKDYGLQLWANTFNSRLSLDDITASGTRIAFDFSDLSEVPDDGVSAPTED
ncbi:phage portal protein [Promicromonospora sp. NFX87]|uniref:phage portal protein n=1 Tax=Promicromonospora sp. NFX87 TaxID=3402691 RepID=UPI003AFA3919